MKLGHPYTCLACSTCGTVLFTADQAAAYGLLCARLREELEAPPPMQAVPANRNPRRR